jgi:cytochrome c553
VEAGKAFYAADCAACHGNKGQGRLKKPAIAPQFIPYLKAQVDSFMTGKRQHDDMEILKARSPEEWKNLWAFLSSLQD